MARMRHLKINLHGKIVNSAMASNPDVLLMKGWSFSGYPSADRADPLEGLATGSRSEYRQDAPQAAQSLAGASIPLS